MLRCASSKWQDAHRSIAVGCGDEAPLVRRQHEEGTGAMRQTSVRDGGAEKGVLRIYRDGAGSRVMSDRRCRRQAFAFGSGGERDDAVVCKLGMHVREAVGKVEENSTAPAQGGRPSWSTAGQRSRPRSAGGDGSRCPCIHRPSAVPVIAFFADLFRGDVVAASGELRMRNHPIATPPYSAFLKPCAGVRKEEIRVSLGLHRYDGPGPCPVTEPAWRTRSINASRSLLATMVPWSRSRSRWRR